MAIGVSKRTDVQQEVDLLVSAQTAASIEEEIALRAYEIYLERGETDGNDVDDWLKAEYELRS